MDAWANVEAARARSQAAQKAFEQLRDSIKEDLRNCTPAQRLELLKLIDHDRWTFRFMVGLILRMRRK